MFSLKRLATFAASCVLAAAVSAEPATMGPYGEKVSLRLSYLFANQNTQLRLDGDSGVGVGVDLEDFFDLDEELDDVWQLKVQGRFKERHRVGAEIYEFRRGASSTLEQDWEGDDIVAKAGAMSDTTLNISIVDITYAYSFLQHEGHELSGIAGLYWMDYEASIKLEGELIVDGMPNLGGNADAGGSLAAPLPVVGLNYDYAIKPRWLVGATFKYFTLRTNKLDGSLVQVSADTRYYFWDHFEVGAGLSIFDLSMTVDMGSFRGRADWSYWGPQVFIGARF